MTMLENFFDMFKYPVVSITAATLLLSTILFYYLRFSTNSSRIVNIMWSLGYHFIRMIKSLFSISLSTKEQSKFEEEFKYLIVTSSLFNGTISPSEQEYRNQEVNTSMINLFHAFIVIISSVLIVIHWKFVTPCSIIYYLLYRHYRHTIIRSIHASALDSMHKITVLSQESDIILSHVMLSESEQQKKLGDVLSSHYEQYVNIVQELEPLIDTNNLARLREMYNMKATMTEFKLDDIDLMYSFIIWKRREYLLHLLALDVMSNNKLAHYGKNWKEAIRINHALYKEYQNFNEKLSAIQSELDIDNSSNNSNTVTDKRLLTMIHKLNTIEKSIQDIQGNLFLCQQSISIGRVPNFNIKNLSKRFDSIDLNVNNLKNQWEESKELLNQLRSNDDVDILPSPPTSPTALNHHFRYDNINRQSYTHSRSQSLKKIPKNIIQEQVNQ